MSEPATAPAATTAPLSGVVINTPHGELRDEATPVVTHAQFAQVAATAIQTVQTAPPEHASTAAHVAASILDSVAQFLPAALQISRASPRTSAEVALGVGIISAILQGLQGLRSGN